MLLKYKHCRMNTRFLGATLRTSQVKSLKLTASRLAFIIFQLMPFMVGLYSNVLSTQEKGICSVVKWDRRCQFGKLNLLLTLIFRFGHYALQIVTLLCPQRANSCEVALYEKI